MRYLFSALLIIGTAIVAIAHPGNLDVSFGTNGQVTTVVGDTFTQAGAAAIQRDGKIIVAGSATISSISHPALIRYNTDGTLDATFGAGGKVITSISGGSASACSVAIQVDGKIVVTDCGSNTGIDVLLIRYNADGTLDTGFGDGGIVRTDFKDGLYYTVSLAIRNSGKIVAAGYGSSAILVQYNADGTLDTNFGVSGKVNFGDSRTILQSLAIQSDGKVVAVGNRSSDTSDYDFLLVRYNSDGLLDAGFGINGIVTTDFFNHLDDVAMSVAIQDGKIIVVGNMTDHSTFRGIAIARYDPTGILDSEFGSGGKVTTAGGTGIWESWNSIAIQADGKIVAAGVANNYAFALARYNSNGSLDSSYGSNGKTLVDFGYGDFDIAYALALDSSGRVVAVGTSYICPWECDSSVIAATRLLGDARKSPLDFDGDGKTDVSVFRPSEGKWYVSKSGGGVKAQNWGLATDVLVPADYDGDGKADVAVWRPSEGNWYFVRSSDSTVDLLSWGINGDIPVAADYDNDGRTDMAVFRPSDGHWYIMGTNTGVQIFNWGVATDIPVPGDYDGDGKTDEAVFRPSEGNWYIIGSSSGLSLGVWGAAGDRPVPADYDGDGKDDLAVFRPSDGNWYIRNSSNNSVTVTSWGFASDIQVPGDYDGDGRDDIAIFRPSEGNWYIIQSRDGLTVNSWGINGDIPIPAKYIP